MMMMKIKAYCFFVSFSLRKMRERIRETTHTAEMIGAAMALLIPTEGVDVATPRVWQYMLIHGTLVFYGFYLALVERVDMSFRAYLNNLKLLAAVTMVAFLMNSVLERYNTNFLFLRVPPMEGLPEPTATPEPTEEPDYGEVVYRALLIGNTYPGTIDELISF